MTTGNETDSAVEGTVLFSVASGLPRWPELKGGTDVILGLSPAAAESAPAGDAVPSSREAAPCGEPHPYQRMWRETLEKLEDAMKYLS